MRNKARETAAPGVLRDGAVFAMIGNSRISVTTSEALSSSWDDLCTDGDLFVSRPWLTVERDRVGPWVPERAAIVTVANGGGNAPIAGMTVQMFGQDVSDETVRLDRMLAACERDVTVTGSTGPMGHEAPKPAAPAIDGVLPAAMLGTWFNSRVLTAVAAEPVDLSTVVATGVDIAQQWHCAAVFMPCVAATDLELRAALAREGFDEFPAPSRHVMPSDTANWNDWLAALPSRKRMRVNRELKALRDAGTSVERVRLAPGHPVMESVAALAANLETKYGQVADRRQMFEWFTSIARNTSAMAFVARSEEGSAVAMSLWIEAGDRMYGFHAGFDYGACRGLPLYSVVGYHEPLRYALSRPHLQLLEFGSGSDEAKRLRGTHERTQILAVRKLAP